MEEIITNGIVLSVMPIGEYDRRVELLSQGLGRISAFAKGARRPNSSLVSCARTFACGSFTLLQSKTSFQIKSARLSELFEGISKEFEANCYGNYFAEAIRFFTYEGDNARDYLNLLYFSLKKLLAKDLPKELVRRVFELKLLQISGVCPSPLKLREAGGSFSFAKGISNECLYVIEHILNSPINALFNFKLSDKVFTEFSSICNSLVALNINRNFKSLEILKSFEEKVDNEQQNT